MRISVYKIRHDRVYDIIKYYYYISYIIYRKKFKYENHRTVIQILRILF